MLEKKSRYTASKPFTNNDGFKGLRARKLPFAQGRIEHTVIETDRQDLLAEHYYRDNRRWWRILDANPEYLYAADMLPMRDKQPAPEKIAIENKNNQDADLFGDVILIPAGSGK